MIRIASGIGTAGTPMAAFDAALADAGVHQYNLRTLSSVIPAGARVERVETVSDLGPTGEALDVVIAEQRSQPGARAAAGLAWARADDGTGVFYEDADHDPETVAEQLAVGMQRGCELRDIDPAGIETEIVTADATPDEYTAAVCLAIYGESTPLF